MSTPKIAQHAQKLFVKNLPWTISSRQLKEYFSNFGYVNTAIVVVDKNTGMSRGYGFISFASKEAHEAAINQKIHSLEGRAITLEEANTT